MAKDSAALAMAASNEVFLGMFQFLLDWSGMIRGMRPNSSVLSIDAEMPAVRSIVRLLRHPVSDILALGTG
jgi:hypothetical protein